uniref:Synaptotagmin 9 n=1 Tax=Ictidomys tridecemlineatus TaxID=43179 RepID=A0A287CSN9_ICTTR
MPGARDALCHQALQLLAELCARGALEHDSCQDFIYHLRDRARPRLRDPGIIQSEDNSTCQTRTSISSSF